MKSIDQEKKKRSLLDFSRLILLVILQEYQHQVQQVFEQMIYLHPIPC